MSEKIMWKNSCYTIRNTLLEILYGYSSRGNVYTNPNLLKTQNHKQQLFSNQAESFEKKAWFESQKDLLKCCINGGLVPKGLELMLDPTISHLDHTFSENWYSKLEQSSLQWKKDIVQFCDKTIAEATSKINITETSLKLNIKQEQFKAIKTKIQSNETTSNKILQQCKFKKFSDLKFKLKNGIQPTL